MSRTFFTGAIARARWGRIRRGRRSPRRGQRGRIRLASAAWGGGLVGSVDGWDVERGQHGRGKAWGAGGWDSGGGIVGRKSRGACPNRPPRPRFLLIGFRVAGLRLSRKIQKNQNQTTACLGRVRRDRQSAFEGRLQEPNAQMPPLAIGQI